MFGFFNCYLKILKLFLYIIYFKTMQRIAAKDYSILFGSTGYEVLNSFLNSNNYSTIFIIVDSTVNDSCLPFFLAQLATEIPIEIIEFESGEENKNITTCIEIWNALTDLGADRKSIILSVGGGVVTDLGGFIAATFKRGIDHIVIPTTLLAMVDASIGGKTGIDLGPLKNQIGVIQTPKMVVIDTYYLETLPANEMRSGLAEMLKHGLIADRAYWNLFLDLSKLDSFELENLIYTSIEIKNNIVLQDPNEIGLRKALNFGHTLGHAIESYFLENENQKTLLHGEAVAIGLYLESYISFQKELLSEKDFLQISNVIKNMFDPVDFENIDLQKILDLLIHDKKNEHRKIQFVLLDGIGNVKINQTVSNELIIASFQEYKYC